MRADHKTAEEQQFNEVITKTDADLGVDLLTINIPLPLRGAL